MIRKILGYGILAGLFIGFNYSLFFLGGWRFILGCYTVALAFVIIIALIQLANYLIEG